MKGGNRGMALHKDRSLDALSQSGNVAQFVAFRPDRAGQPVQSFSRIRGWEPNAKFATTADALAALLEAAPEGSINVRSYEPGRPQSNEFVYGVRDVALAEAHIRRLSKLGMHTIGNETIDVHDGGVSGVVHGDVIEFAPDDTPRCVERPGVATFPRNLGLRFLEAVYGIALDVPDTSDRIEFSIHPRPRGFRGGHTVLWEQEQGVPLSAVAPLRWPNRFSRHIGDKAFGLLVAWVLGHPVTQTHVIPRRVRPFLFGESTGSAEVWIRTCPVEPEPGHFTTAKGWLDPFALLAREDAAGDRIASVLSQAAVAATFSGAAIYGGGSLLIEGAPGGGDRFMLGLEPPQDLPADVRFDVEERYNQIADVLGPIRLEWVHDGQKVWIVQLHCGGTDTHGAVIVPGEADVWINFRVEEGLERLRALTETMAPRTGVLLIGEVGRTSHIADVVRRAGCPARITAE
jgi:hypothetical protein